MMRFSQDEIDAAVSEFTANAQSRTVAAAGFNGEITVYGVQNVTIQTAAGQNTRDGDTGPDGG